MSLKTRWRRWVARRIPAAAQVQLNQRRIFIMPDRVGAAFTVLLVLMLLAAINYENSLAYGLTFLLAAIFVIAILHTYRNFSGLILKAGASGAVFAGEQARFRVRLESAEHAHQAIALGWPGQPLQTLDVPPGSERECELGLPALRRGWLRAERMRVESHFPLGILVAWSWVDLDQSVLVYPRPLAGDLPLASGAGEDAEEEGRRASGQGADDYQGLRSYQPGDSKRRLHWKAFSRGQGLLVKDFAALSGRDLWLDFQALGGDAEERLSRLCHWVLQLDTRQQPYGLRLPGCELAPDYGEGHREACLRALALYGERR
ncbi:DUF58 domain-containing protein [Pseudomonas sp. BMS12]|uniref:DUF58 domain-containing protein n=1 Tax=Pseudomonas sp. BMS12 TaxID=1796033 RepID=UPI00083B93F7|nr:DUF58 domain-containing protein [Pseudomonas sp. BMS12]